MKTPSTSTKSTNPGAGGAPPGPGRGRKKAAPAAIQEQAAGAAPGLNGNGAGPETQTFNQPVGQATAQPVTLQAPATQQPVAAAAGAAQDVTWSSTHAFREQIARAAIIGKQLQAINSQVMQGLPITASDEEIGLHLVSSNLDKYEGAVRVLEMPAA